MSNNISNSNGELRRCKWCGAALQGGRPSKAYCNDACKQAAYYDRRKQPSRNSIVIESNGPNVTSQELECVTKPGSLTDKPSQVGPETTINYQSNNHFTMGNKHKTSRNTEKSSQASSPSPEPVISVMGMGIDREFITGLLEALPEAQQRDLSLMLMRTVLERHPDLLEQLAGTQHQCGEIGSVTDGPHLEHESNDDEANEGDDGYEQQDDDEVDSDSDGEGREEDDDNDATDNSDDEYGDEADDDSDPSEDADESDLPEDEDDVDGGDDDQADEHDDMDEKEDGQEQEDGHEKSYYAGLEASDGVHSGHRHGGLEALFNTSAEHTPSNADDNTMRQQSRSTFVTSHEPNDESEDLPVYRLGGNRHEGDTHHPDVTVQSENRNKPHEQFSFHAAPSRHPDVTKPHENDVRLRQQNANGHEALGGYLSRFASTRISRGMSVWEELSVTVPVFMEGHVVRCATEHMIGVQSAGDAGGRLVTLHILFHRSQHRRAICRLLDLILEAEEGLLREADFKPDGSFPAYQSQDEEKDIEDDEAEENCKDDDDSAAPVDYECYGSGTPNAYASQGGAAYVSAQNIATHQSTNTVLQILGIVP